MRSHSDSVLPAQIAVRALELLLLSISRKLLQCARLHALPMTGRCNGMGGLSMGRYASRWQDDQAETGSSAAINRLASWRFSALRRTHDCGVLVQRSQLPARLAYSTLSSSKRRSCSQGTNSCCSTCCRTIRLGFASMLLCESSLPAESHMLVWTDGEPGPDCLQAAWKRCSSTAGSGKKKARRLHRRSTGGHTVTLRHLLQH